MDKLPLVAALFLALIISSCGFEEQRRKLDEREQLLQQREKNLLLHEKQLVQLEDSVKLILSKNDSVQFATRKIGLPLPDSLKGGWNINMNCIQTNCNGFAVGDVRKETWLFSGGDSTGVYVKAMNGDKLVRIYAGIYNGTGFELSTPAHPDSRNGATMHASIIIENSNKLSGQRIINQADGCATTFKLDGDRVKPAN